MVKEVARVPEKKPKIGRRMAEIYGFISGKAKFAQYEEKKGENLANVYHAYKNVISREKLSNQVDVTMRAGHIYFIRRG